MVIPVLPPDIPRDLTDESLGGTGPASADDVEGGPASSAALLPVGHVITGLPPKAPFDALVAALVAAGWDASGVRPATLAEGVAALRGMEERAVARAGGRSEITLSQRYGTLTEAGHRWLLIRVGCSDDAAAAAAAARACGAELAVHFRVFTVEDLIP